MSQAKDQQALVLDVARSPYELKLPGIGTLHLRMESETVVGAVSLNGILYEGLLYSFQASFAKAEDTWYPISGVVLTGAGAIGKAPAKIQTTLISKITAAIQGHLAFNIETMLKAYQIERHRHLLSRAQRQVQHEKQNVAKWEREIQSVEDYRKENLNDAKTRLAQAQTAFMEHDAALRNLLGDMQDALPAPPEK